jgi:hypothetical protein
MSGQQQDQKPEMTQAEMVAYIRDIMEAIQEARTLINAQVAFSFCSGDFARLQSISLMLASVAVAGSTDEHKRIAGLLTAEYPALRSASDADDARIAREQQENRG